jgi:hypothetical protein
MSRFQKWANSQICLSGFPWVPASITYLISYGFSLFLGSTYFWDDWLNRISKEEFAFKARLSGFPPTREFIEFNLLGNSAIAFRIVTFISYFLGALCIHRILGRGLSLTNVQINVVTLLFLVAPVNATRVAMIIMHYSLSLVLFLIAWLLLSSRRATLHLLALPIFWISFGTPSLLPFFLLPLSHWILLNRTKIRSAKFAGLLLLLGATPISYWIVRSMTFGSAVREYYVPRPLGVLRGGLLVLVAGGVLAYGLRRRHWSMSENSRPLLASLGFIAIALGASTYMAGGHLVDISDWVISFVPNFSDWDSRHQLLLGLGLALMLCAALVSPREGRLTSTRLGAVVATIVVFTSLNFTFGQEYYLDSLKQRAIIAEFKSIPELSTIDSVMIDDQALRFNARGRAVRSVEWQEMINISLRRSSKIIAEPLRYVDCDEFQPKAILRITAENGRLETLLTRNIGVSVSIERISPCG